ncbi:MAG TPA: hypothetical protein VN965_01910 [Candidatus Dormibacteraeota bacterium]|nr:hypothetical protein [Candidatus Dormibacteraeota bacterium]
MRIRGRDYPVILPSIRDARLHVAAVLLTLQVLGQTVLGFRLSVAQILVSLAVGALIEFGVAFFKDHLILWPASGLLTGNSTAFILRVPGTLHGQWWSLHGIYIFIGVVALGMATKYLIRWRGRHIFNPSNVALVLAFIVLGPTRTEPLDLWWIPMGPWMIVTYAILIGGGVFIGWRLGLLAMEVAFMASFAIFVALALAPVPDHCMVASWHLSPLCGRSLWEILVTSPEVLIFALFMIPDPRTVPDGRVARIVFGVIVALFAVLLLGPTTLEFWTKTAILASLVLACALRFALTAFLASVRDASSEFGLFIPGLRVPAFIALACICMGCLPVASDLSTHSPQPVAGLSDGTTPAVSLVVGAGPGIGSWVGDSARDALPPPVDAQLVGGSASAQLWVLPAVPPISIASNVSYFNASMTPQVAARMGHDAVLDLVIEAEARRAHNLKLAESGAAGDGLTEFVGVINDDVAAGKFVLKVYKFDSATLNLFLPKFTSQASRLVGLTLTGTATLITKDQSGRVLSQTTTAYSKSWSVGAIAPDGHLLIDQDYSDLRLAP